jgi:hypothetical protein
MTMANGAPVTQANSGGVGTNGNLTASGNAVINGSLSTPRTGAGNCKNGAVDAETLGGQATITGGLVQLPQAIAYTLPPAPTPAPPTTTVSIPSGATCASAGIAGANCSASGSSMTLTPGGTLTLGDVKVTGGETLHLTAGTYNFNSISLAGNSSIVIDSGPVVLNVAGQSQTTPIDFTGGTVTNASFIPSNFQILYGGTGTVKLSGGSATAEMLYAPNAAASLTGGSNLYGSILAKTVDDSGGTKIHYDRHLQTTFDSAGNFMLSSFTWKKY